MTQLTFKPAGRRRSGAGWGVVTTKSTAEGPITMVGASTSLLTLALALTLTNTRPSIY